MGDPGRPISENPHPKANAGEPNDIGKTGSGLHRSIVVISSRMVRKCMKWSSRLKRTGAQFVRIRQGEARAIVPTREPATVLRVSTLDTPLTQAHRT